MLRRLSKRDRSEPPERIGRHQRQCDCQTGVHWPGHGIDGPLVGKGQGQRDALAREHQRHGHHDADAQAGIVLGPEIGQETPQRGPAFDIGGGFVGIGGLLAVGRHCPTMWAPAPDSASHAVEDQRDQKRSVCPPILALRIARATSRGTSNSTRWLAKSIATRSNRARCCMPERERRLVAQPERVKRRGIGKGQRHIGKRKPFDLERAHH